MSQNLLPNRPTQTTGYNSKFSAWTPTVVTGTALVATWSATSGPDSTPGISLSCTGTSATLSLVSGKLNVSAEQELALSVVLAASSVVPTIIPWSITFKDANGNVVLTVAAPSAVAANTSAMGYYSPPVAVPDGAVSAVVTIGAMNFTSVGGYSIVYSSPNVSAL